MTTDQPTPTTFDSATYLAALDRLCEAWRDNQVEMTGDSSVRYSEALDAVIALSDVTQPVTAVLEAARVIAANLRDRHPDDLDMNERELLNALDALEPPAPALPPIPEPGYYLDRSGCCWHFDGGYPIGFGDEVGTPWEQAHTWGPFTRLVPATDVVDAGIVRELTAELTATAPEACAGHWRMVEGRYYGVDFDRCERPDCVRRRELLARAEGATGGGR